MAELTLPPYVERNAEFGEHGVGSVFVGRVPGIDVQVDRDEALARLSATHQQLLNSLGLASRRFCIAEQVHGSIVASVTYALPDHLPVLGTDGLVTNDARCVLGIYVADCCAVSIVDPVNRAIGLVHSGRKGSELDIAGEAINRMSAEYGSKPADIIVHLSPCIRPPHYEVDFAATIRQAAGQLGVKQVLDSGTCTAANVDRYYSYRLEKGRTGRMLSLLWLT